MYIGTASARLKKTIMLQLLQKLGEEFCYRWRKDEGGQGPQRRTQNRLVRCGPVLFWDLDNVTFSHPSCNVGSRRRSVERLTERSGARPAAGSYTR